MFEFLLGSGFGMSLFALLFPTIGTFAIAVGFIAAVIFQPNGKLMKSIFESESEGGLTNLWILLIYLLVFLTVIILVYVFWNTWTEQGFLLYVGWNFFADLFYECFLPTTTFSLTEKQTGPDNDVDDTQFHSLDRLNTLVFYK